MRSPTIVAGEIPPSRFATGPKSSGWWGIVLLMLIESAVFVGMISSYFYLFANAPVWPPPGIPTPELTSPIIHTVLLAVSAVLAFIGYRKIANDGDVAAMRLWTVAGMVLLAVVVGLKVYDLMTLPYQWDENAYTSIFWLMSGFHIGHASAILLLTIPMQILAWQGFFTHERRSALEVATMYWIFVAAWWIPMFATLYLFPNYA